LAHQKGFRTALQGGLQVTGSNWRRGVSGFSFRGVYNAPMGTTSLEASYFLLNLRPWKFEVFTYHARAGENIPTETDAVPVLHLTPLLFQCLMVHFGFCAQLSLCIGRPCPREALIVELTRIYDATRYRSCGAPGAKLVPWEEVVVTWG
jgi:hypothetical protein